MDEKQKQEMKEKAKVVAAETAQKAKDAGKVAAAKADELYNKLPLDQINEKLGGKVDVKSKKFKIGLIVTIGILAIIGCILLFSGSDTIPTDDLKFMECLLRDKKLFMEFGSVGVVNKKKGLSIQMKRGKETFQEYIARCKKQYNEKDLKLYEEEVKSGMKNIDAEYAALKKQYDLLKTREKRIKILAQKAVEILNKNFDEGFDTCKKVEVGRCFYVGPDYGNGKTTIERYEGTAFIYNSRTGKTRERNLDMTINLDEGLYFVQFAN